ncbi:CHAT domain-containing protein [Rhodobacteraceae bacterium NNCM2]|nr:CHAT domain-containing protein [Coraliihabitans acroporae]
MKMITITRTAYPLLLAALFGAASCTQYVETPEIRPTHAEPIPAEQLPEVLARITPGYHGNGTEGGFHPNPNPWVDNLKDGDDMGYGVTMTPESERLWVAGVEHDWETFEATYEAAKASLPDTPSAAFLLTSFRIRSLMHAGRMDDVRAELENLEAIELELFGNVIETTSQYAQLNSWLNNSMESVAYNARVIDTAGDWWLPTFYYAKPENTVDAKRIAGAIMRSHIGLSCEHVVLHEYEQAAAWGRAGLDRVEDVIGISHNPIYGLFVKTTTYMYEGEAWMLACYAAGRIGMSHDLEANQYLIDLAKDFFRQADYKWGDLVVDAIIDYVLYDIGLKPQEPEVIGPLGEPALVTTDRLAKAVRFRPENLQVREGLELPVPDPDTIKLPGEGAKNAYGFVVSPELAEANEALLAGRYDAAVTILDRIAAREKDPLKRWHAYAQGVQALILAGRSAKAIERIPELERREIAYFGTNIGARSLRGDAKFWLGDNQGSVRDFLQVVEALGDFRAPSLFVFKPQIPQLALLNRTQFRAYLGIARALMYSGDYAAALPWANAAEQLFEETHYAWQHVLYKHYLKIDADMFYGRGVNLAVMAASQMVLEDEDAEVDEMIAASKAYLDALSFDAGLTTVDAIWARALLDSGHPELAAEVAAGAAEFAASQGQADLLWQVQSLRGEALAELGRDREAEPAFRAAQNAIDAVSGSLATDSSKRHFGLGKDDVTRRLVAYDIAKGDMAATFRDLERARARAFVDMIGQTRFAKGGQTRLIDEIRDLDAKIREERVRASAPGRAIPGRSRTLDQMTARRAAKITSLRARDPERADALSISTRQLPEIQRRLNAGDVMLYALPADPGVEDAPIRFLRITRSTAGIVDTALSQSALESLLTPFTTDDPLGTVDLQVEAADRIANGLDLAALTGSGVTYVVPSGALYFVPWGALPITAPVVQLPTGGWLARSPRRISSGRAVVVGDPDLGLSWESLPGARREASNVATLYRVEPLTGTAATLPALRESVGKGVGVLHLATHGIFNAQSPLMSEILLSGEDGSDSLTAATLLEEPLPAELVVLSACETGLGQVSAGDDFLGLARSFYLSGTRAVVNALWPVHDKPTQIFMETFHRELAAGDLGNAWLTARDTLVKQGYPPSVYGAFILGGAARL